ncbi:hypothetical protein CLV53_11483 [Sediminibacterium magnilacihabitans]|nr:hypothetical protein CLV53_11483 [Sediminibacterium magnilacihabitans]
MLKIILCFCLLFCCAAVQLNRYRVYIAGFYNLENLYDTVDNPIVNDDEFTPSGDKRYNGKIYTDKLTRLATVIREIGTDYSPDGVALLGVAEIENDTVLQDLVNHSLLKQRQYRFIHYDSRDSRGVDVALLYQPKYFKPQESIPLQVTLPGKSKDAVFTRDILYVRGLLDGETVHIYVNHWPSRRGGEARSSPAREATAATCRAHFALIRQADPAARILVMGDLNDNPDNKSVVDVLKARGDPRKLAPDELYNPWLALYRKGIGTLAHRDSWGLFDQILLTPSWLRRKEGLFFYRQHIHIKPYMMQKSGRYKGYPLRTWEGNSYQAGYSDHFPVFIVLLKNS